MSRNPQKLIGGIIVILLTYTSNHRSGLQAVKIYSLFYGHTFRTMTFMKHPYTQFDLPTRHLGGDNHYVPPRARDSSEIDRRRSLPSGTILLEQQHRGLLITQDVLQNVQDAEDTTYAAQFIAACGLNSAWYQYARGSTYMRRHIALPYLVRPKDHPRPSCDEVLDASRKKIVRVAEAAGALATLHAEQKFGQSDRAISLGRSMAHATLEAACAPLADALYSRKDFALQAAVRTHCLNILDNARTLGLELGTPPSFAQLADPDSDLSVHIRREAPSDVYYAFDEAWSMHAMPR